MMTQDAHETDNDTDCKETAMKTKNAHQNENDTDCKETAMKTKIAHQNENDTDRKETAMNENNAPNLGGEKTEMTGRPANDNVPRTKAKERHNNCQGIWHYEYFDLTSGSDVGSLVGHFEGSPLGEDTSLPQFLADLAIVWHLGHRWGTLSPETRTAMANGIERVLEQIPHAEAKRSHALYVRALKSPIRRSEIRDTYLKLRLEGTFEDNMALLLNLGKAAA